MKTLQLCQRRTIVGRRGELREVFSEQELSSPRSATIPHAPVRDVRVTPARVAEIRRQIAAGVYLHDTEQHIAAVVDGLLRDLLLTDIRQHKRSCRAAV